MPDTRADLLTLLAAAPGLSQQSLARRLGVSDRTARRHLTDLTREGAVLVTADGSSRLYRLADHAYPAAAVPRLTEAEAEALSVAALAARDILAPTPLAAAVDSAAEKLRRAWIADVFSFEPEYDPTFWSFDGAAGGRIADTHPRVFRALLEAARNHNPVRADYYTASRDALTRGRRLAPLGFLVRSGAWLVVAADLDGATGSDGPPAIKDFALAGFQSAERLPDESALPPEGFDLADYARDRFGALAGAVEEVRVLVEPEAVPAFRRKLYNPTQQIEEERPDGRAVVSFEAGGMDSVKAWVLSWGPKVRVLAPESLAAGVALAQREAAKRYSSR